MQKVENIKKVNLNANEFQELTIYNDGKLAFISNLKDIDVSSMEKFMSLLLCWREKLR